MANRSRVQGRESQRERDRSYIRLTLIPASKDSPARPEVSTTTPSTINTIWGNYMGNKDAKHESVEDI